MPTLPGATQDLRYGLRMFARTPGFTTLVLLTLALGIGATTAIFSIVHAVLLQPLPYRNPERLMVVWNTAIHQKGSKLFATYRDFENWRDHSCSFEQLDGVTWATAGALMTGRGSPRNVLAIPATPGLFSLLGVPPALGRTFQPDDLARGCTIVLAHKFWQGALGGQANIVGHELRLADRPCTVAGVMPASFVFYPEQTELWTLITPASDLARNPDRSGIAVFGRRKAGVSKEAAEAELRALAHQINGGIRFAAEMEPIAFPLQEEFTWLAGRNLRLSLIVLFGAVTFVLLIACVNAANLLLGKALVRQRELTIRAAVGSSRARLLRQLLTESLLLSLIAAGIGTGLAIAAVRYFASVNPVELPPGSAVAVNVPVLAFTVALSLLTTILFGFLPAWKASRVDLNESLKSGGRGSQGRGRHRLAKGLIAVEVVLSLVLLTGAGLLIQSVARFASAPVGFEINRLATVEVKPPPKAYAAPAQRVEFYGALMRELRTLPGVEGAALSTVVPLRGGGGSNVLIVEGRPEPTPKTAVHEISQQGISESYFRVMGIPLRAGREFEARDALDAPGAAIVNEALARKYFPNENPVGRHIRILGERDAWLTIAGVAADEKRTIVYQEMGWNEPPIVYRPLAQQAPASVNLMIRGASALSSMIEERARKLDPDLYIGKPQAVEHLAGEFLKYPRFRAQLLGTFAAMALLLAVVGLYGVLSQLVAQRTQEIGLRMALGAQKGDVLRMVVREGMLMAAVGVAIGIGAASLLTRLLASLLYGVGAEDPVTMAAVSLLLLAAAFFAAYVPARRAARVDPMVALRYE